MRFHGRLALIALLSLVAACSSGGGSGTCDNTNPVPPGMAPASSLPTPPAWPQFRHDNYNTGHADVFVSGSLPPAPTPAYKWVYPPPGGPTPGPNQHFVSAPAVSADGARVYIGSTDGTLYALDKCTGIPDHNFAFNFSSAFPSATTGAIVGSPTLDTAGNIYVSTDSFLLVIKSDGTEIRTAAIGGPGAAPVLATENVPNRSGVQGTAYVGSVSTASSGSLPAVCANGINRWDFAGDPVAAPPAIGPDGTVYFSSASTLRPFLRAIDGFTAQVIWTYGASGPLFTPPILEVVDNQVQTIYVASSISFIADPESAEPSPTPGTSNVSDRLFKIRVFPVPTPTVGPAPMTEFSFPVSPGSHIVGAPALGFPINGATSVYVTATDGKLYAVDTETGAGREFDTRVFNNNVPPLAIQSSPIVAHDGDNPANAIIIFGSDDGRLYRVVDDGVSLTSKDADPAEIGMVGKASPAVGPDGTIYIGTQDGHVYAIGGNPCQTPPPTPTATATPTPTPT